MAKRLTAAGAAAMWAVGLVAVQAAHAQPVYFGTTGSWYELVTGGSYTWDQAHATAMTRTHNGLRGHLAAVTSQEETDFIKNTFLIPSPGHTFWLGGNQPAYSTEPAGNWQWVTGEPWIYSNWDGGEPNNRYHGNAPEDRAEIYGDGAAGRIATWNDTPSYAEVEGYLVEYELIPAQNPVRWAGNGHWYELVEPGDTICWFNAKVAAALRSHNGETGHLATITSEPENAFVTDTLLSRAEASACWLGGYQPDGSPEPDGNWQWVTGESWTYDNWEPGEPNDWYGSHPEEVLAAYAGPSNFPIGTWNDTAEFLGLRSFLVEYVPEPATLSLLAIGGLLLIRRRAR